MHLQITMSATAADLSEPNLVKMDTTTSMEEVNNNNNSFKENEAKQTTFANFDPSSVIAENNLGKCRHIFGFSQEAADTTLFFVKTCAQGVSLTVKSEFVAAATITFDDFLVRPLIKGGCYLRAATIPNLLI